MALGKNDAEQIKQLVKEHESFVVSLKKTYWLHETDDEEVRQVRDFMRLKVIAPLVSASIRVVIYGSECVAHDFDHPERKNLDRLLVKKGASYEVRLDDPEAVVHDFPDFWAGSLYDSESKRRYNRGYVLFLVDDQKLDFSRLFSCYSNVSVVTNLAGSVGRGLYKRAKKYTEEHSDRTAVALIGGTRLALFPGSDVIDLRLEQAIRAVNPD